MRTPVRTAIQRAYKLINFVQDDIIKGKEDALHLLNNIIAFLNIDPTKVGYPTKLEFTLVAQKYEYTVGTSGYDITSKPLVSLNYAEYKYNTTFYHIKIIDRQSYYSSSRDVSVLGFPNAILLEKQNNYSILKFLPTPDQSYPVTLQIHLDRLPITIDDDFEDIMPAAYDLYMIYKLAKFLHNSNPGSKWKQEDEQTLQKLESDITALSPLDTTIRGDTTLVYSYDNQYNAFKPFP
jgi:hypothetical protein